MMRGGGWWAAIYRGISRGKSAMEQADFDDFFFTSSPDFNRMHDRRRSRSNSRQAVTSTL